MSSNPLVTPTDDLLAGFKMAMRRLASTVTIISTCDGAQRYGMAATAVNSVTTAPPSLLICVNKCSSIYAPLVSKGFFCVNLLGVEHQDLVAVYGGKATGEDRFNHGTWLQGYEGLPWLQNAPANLFCSVLSATECGSHILFIGEVLEVVISGETRPLIYQEGGLFRTVSMLPSSGLPR